MTRRYLSAAVIVTVLLLSIGSILAGPARKHQSRDKQTHTSSRTSYSTKASGHVSKTAKKSPNIQSYAGGNGAQLGGYEDPAGSRGSSGGNHVLSIMKNLGAFGQSSSHWIGDATQSLTHASQTPPSSNSKVQSAGPQASRTNVLLWLFDLASGKSSQTHDPKPGAKTSGPSRGSGPTGSSGGGALTGGSTGGSKGTVSTTSGGSGSGNTGSGSGGSSGGGAVSANAPSGGGTGSGSTGSGTGGSSGGGAVSANVPSGGGTGSGSTGSGSGGAASTSVPSSGSGAGAGSGAAASANVPTPGSGTGGAGNGGSSGGDPPSASVPASGGTSGSGGGSGSAAANGASAGSSYGGAGTGGDPAAASSGTGSGATPGNLIFKAVNQPAQNVSAADLASIYDLVVLTSGNVSMVQQIKRLNPNVKVLLYQTLSDVYTYEGFWSEVNGHESWFMHDPSGQRTKNGSDSYMMDLRNSDYRAYQAKRVADWVNGSGFDGIFWDDAIPTLDLFTLNPGPDPTARSTYHKDFLTLVQQIKGALGSKWVITNSTQPYNTGNADADDTDFLPYLDGTMMEAFGHAPWDAATGTPSDWGWQQSMAQRNIRAGKFISTLSGLQLAGASPAQIHQWQLFTYGSALLAADDGHHFYYQWSPWGTDQQGIIFPELTAPIGSPLGPAYSTDGVVSQRDFTGGKVVVNPTWGSVTVTLPIGLQTLDGSVSTSVNTSQQVQVSPWSALILFKQ